MSLAIRRGMKEQAQNSENRSHDEQPPPQRPWEYTTETLFGNAREILIRHRGQLYRLRITGTDKLILTK